MPIFPNQRPSRRYTAIFKDHYEPKSEDQVRYLDDLAELFLYPQDVVKKKKVIWPEAWKFFSKQVVKDYFTSDEIGAYACPFHLANISKAYFIDIIRYKEYHYNPSEDGLSYEKYAEEIHGGPKPQLLGSDKRAAFLIKWILKAQPIQVDVPGKVDLKNYQHQQEVWYVNEQFALFVLWQELGVKADKVPVKERSRLIHQFRYRVYDENLFSMIFKQIQEQYR